MVKSFLNNDEKTKKKLKFGKVCFFELINFVENQKQNKGIHFMQFRRTYHSF